MQSTFNWILGSSITNRVYYYHISFFLLFKRSLTLSSKVIFIKPISRIIKAATNIEDKKTSLTAYHDSFIINTPLRPRLRPRHKAKRLCPPFFSLTEQVDGGVGVDTTPVAVLHGATARSSKTALSWNPFLLASKAQVFNGIHRYITALMELTRSYRSAPRRGLTKTCSRASELCHSSSWS